MAATYEPIASVTLGSAAADITLSSIGSGWTDLVLVLSGAFATATNNLLMQVNSDTGSNYSTTELLGDGSSTASIRQSSQTRWRMSQNYVTDPTVWTFHFMSYADANVYKTVLGTYAAASYGVERRVALWRSTSAITSIKVYASSGNLAAGFTASLYGIKAA